MIQFLSNNAKTDNFRLTYFDGLISIIINFGTIKINIDKYYKHDNLYPQHSAWCLLEQGISAHNTHVALILLQFLHANILPNSKFAFLAKNSSIFIFVRNDYSRAILPVVFFEFMRCISCNFQYFMMCLGYLVRLFCLENVLSMRRYVT